MHTEEEAASNNGESHHNGRYLVRCSTPLMVPELNQQVTDNNVLPCGRACDVKEERYNEPCPDCRGDLPFRQVPPPNEVWNCFLPGETGEDDDLMDQVTERAAESLARTIYCWVNMHWSMDLGTPSDEHAPDMAKEIVSTWHDLVCVEQTSHGSSANIFPSENLCSCALNESPEQYNMATAMRRWMSRQTAMGHEYFRAWADHRDADESFLFDLRPHWNAVSIRDWVRNPFFEFANTDIEPDIANNERLSRVEEGPGPLFGLEAALRCSQKRVSRMIDWESWQNPPCLGYCEPLTEGQANTRYKALEDQILLAIEPYRTSKGLWVGMLALEKIAHILAHDTGLVDYRVHLIMERFLRSFDYRLRNPPEPAPAVDHILRPVFGPPYVDALFDLLMTNADEYASFLRAYRWDPAFGAKLWEGTPEGENESPVDENGENRWPPWARKETSDEEEERLRNWRDQHSWTLDAMKIKAKMIDALTVKYVPNLVTDFCTSCKRRLTRGLRPGSQLCMECKRRSGYEGLLRVFGDPTFLAKVNQETGPMESWECCICRRDLNSGEPPCEVPAETIRCHKVAHSVAGSACLRRQLLGHGEHNKMTGAPTCPLDRQYLSVWEDNYQQGREDMNDPEDNPYLLYHLF